MKKLMLTALGAAALALSACGDSLPPETDASPEAVQGRTFELRLRGDNAEGYGAVLVPIASMDVTAGGARLPVRLVARTVDLTAKDHAHLLGTFTVPEGVEQVQVALTFDDFGGWEQGLRAGALDTRVAPLRFSAPVDSLSKRGRAVVQLDVGQSLLPVAEQERLLLPNLTVNY
ncbi:hypothetical protein [Hyalangium rubrum]|uniref:Lipoprotein n=1 Tax=Hyalangium rubrum TaxID=3103134 RepID=A0ABU5GYL9_9BACT|nr:hypothetical protein [Hyalangium sp. s54d21]MDY7226295.1 hypothetical protein [Hyalangium sp. s54d21]